MPVCPPRGAHQAEGSPYLPLWTTARMSFSARTRKVQGLSVSKYGRGLVGALGDRGDEAIPPAVVGLDDLLPHAVVAHRLAGFSYAARQRGLTDDLTRPELLEQLVSGDKTVTMTEEVDKHLEHFGLEFDGAAGSAQLVPGFAQFAVAEDGNPRRGGTRAGGQPASKVLFLFGPSGASFDRAMRHRRSRLRAAGLPGFYPHLQGLTLEPPLPAYLEAGEVSTLGKSVNHLFGQLEQGSNIF
jgi:hypothetical protein